MLRTSKRTAYGDELQTSMLYGAPYTVRQNTTFNEALAINANTDDVVLGSGIYTKVQYWAIGQGGHTVQADANGKPYVDTVDHRPTDAFLFDIIPFVLRLESNDLTADQRANYALRRQEEHGGQNYFAYYLKRFDLAGAVTNLTKKSTRSSVVTTTEFTPDSTNLSPEPPVLPAEGSVPVGDKDEVLATLTIGIPFTDFDIDELKNVSTILHGSTVHATISEIAICAGIDSVLPSPAVGGGTINQDEAIHVQPIQHITTFNPYNFITTGSDFTLEAGSSEPLVIEA